MFYLHNTLASWPNESFTDVLKAEMQTLSMEDLPLQQALQYAAHVSDKPITVTLLKTSESDAYLLVKAGIFYNGIISGCSCADDPSPNTETNEYCTVEISINKDNAATTVKLLIDDE
jgi:hypothetical protein